MQNVVVCFMLIHLSGQLPVALAKLLNCTKYLIHSSSCYAFHWPVSFVEALVLLLLSLPDRQCKTETAALKP